MHDGNQAASNAAVGHWNSEAPLASYHQALAKLAEAQQLRTCRVWPGSDRPLINFSGNDYLGLSTDPRLKAAAQAAIAQYGASASSSRLISGTGELVHALEQQIAHWKQCEAALVFNSGYQGNVAILQALLQPGDTVLCDRLNHASLLDGCRLSGARLQRYHHLDLAHLERLLQKNARTRALEKSMTGRTWLVTDSVFSMDGDYPDLSAWVDLAERYHALTLVDEAHAAGVFGSARGSGRGAGLCEAQGVSHRVTLQMGTFSKALGGFGAYVAGPQVLIQTLINKARGFIYSTALPPAVLAAASEAIRVVQEDPEPRERLWRNIQLLNARLSTVEFVGTALGEAFQQTGGLRSSILPVVLGSPEKAQAVSQALENAGYWVYAVRPPSVPAGTSRLRITLSASHTSTQIEDLAAQLANALRFYR